MATPTHLIVVMAFDPDPEAGDLIAAIEPMQFDSAERAVRMAKELSNKHIGVIAWARTADPNLGEYGEPEVLFQAGEVAEME